MAQVAQQRFEQTLLMGADAGEVHRAGQGRVLRRRADLPARLKGAASRWCLGHGQRHGVVSAGETPRLHTPGKEAPRDLDPGHVKVTVVGHLHPGADHRVEANWATVAGLPDVKTRGPSAPARRRPAGPAGSRMRALRSPALPTGGPRRWPATPAA